MDRAAEPMETNQQSFSELPLDHPVVKTDSAPGPEPAEPVPEPEVPVPSTPSSTPLLTDLKQDLNSPRTDLKDFLPSVSDIESALNIKLEKPLSDSPLKFAKSEEKCAEEKPDQADMDGASALAALASAASIAQNNVKQETNGIKSELDEVSLLSITFWFILKDFIKIQV